MQKDLIENGSPKYKITIGFTIGCHYIYFLLYNIYHLCFTCIDFYYLSAWGGCWFVVYIRRFIYNFSNVCPFDYTAVAASGKVGPVNQVNHTSWVAIVTPSDRIILVSLVLKLWCEIGSVESLEVIKRQCWRLWW